LTLLLALSAAVPVEASHQSPKSLPAIAASGWTNPSNALSDDSTHASTSAGGSTITFSDFAASNLKGTVQGVSFVFRQSQASHANDRYVVGASESTGGCGGVGASPSNPEATSATTEITVTLTCSNGWTWQRLDAVSVSVASQRVDPLILVPEVDGEWRIQFAKLLVAYTNQAPTASAGPDQDVNEGASVTLDASASSDPDADTISYTWSQTDGPNVVLAGATTAKPSFTAPTRSTNTPVTLRFSVQVTDVQGHAATDGVDVVVRNVNQAPFADAGSDQNVRAGDTVSMDGTGSRDPDSDPLTFAWTQTGGAGVSLSDPASATPSFEAPGAAATLTFSLVVQDNQGAQSAPDAVTVTVASASNGGDVSPTPAPSPTPSPSPSVSPSASPSPTTGPAPEVRLEPDRMVLKPGDSIDVRAVVTYPGRDDVVPEAGACAWEAAASGGSLDANGTFACQRTYTAGDALGTFRLTVQVDTEAGDVVADAEISIGVSARPVPPDEVPDGVLERCDADVPPQPQGGAVVVGFDGGCGLEMVLLELAGPAPQPMRLRADVLAGLPSDVAEPELAIARSDALEIGLVDDAGAPVSVTRATVRFALEAPWIEANCPTEECEVRLLHYADGAWESLETELLDSLDGDNVYEARSEGFSLFVPVGVPIAVPPVEAAGIPLWMWIVGALVLGGGVTGGVLAVARRRREPERPVGEPAPNPPVGNLMDELRNEELVQFLNNAAHDLASPLTPIKLQLAILDATGIQEMGEKQRTALEVVARNIEHMGMLVQDVKDASRLQAGKLQVFPEPVDVAVLARHAVETFYEQAKEAGVRLDTKASVEGLPIMGDKGRLNQVLYNLINNAIKFTPEDGNVRVEMHERDGKAYVLVRDTGLGLTQDDIDHLFQPFSQVHDAAQKKKGSGLGLYICKGILEAHGGRVWCESPGRGQGSTFAFQIPLRQEVTGNGASVEESTSPVQLAREALGQG
jgi:signal transduction histidine kinase